MISDLILFLTIEHCILNSTISISTTVVRIFSIEKTLVQKRHGLLFPFIEINFSLIIWNFDHKLFL